MAIFQGTSINDLFSSAGSINSDDTYLGYGGNDSYFFRWQTGDDTVQDSGGKDTLNFTMYTGSEHYVATRQEMLYRSGKDLIIQLQSGQKVTVENQFAGSRVEYIKLDDEGPRRTFVSGTKGSSRGYEWVVGTAGNDKLFSGGGSYDVLDGGPGSDTLFGGSGSDTLNGGTGNDRMLGGSGYDWYVVDARGDKVVETEADSWDGVDSWISYTLPARVEELNLKGDKKIIGIGNGLSNELIGNDNDNALSGRDGDDTIHGGLGSDTLAGGDGSDYFYYECPDEGGDTIKDFSMMDYDFIKIYGPNFGNLKEGHLSESQFLASSKGVATTTAQRFIFNTRTGALVYDKNGSRAGGATTIAMLNVRSLYSSYIYIVGQAL